MTIDEKLDILIKQMERHLEFLIRIDDRINRIELRGRGIPVDSDFGNIHSQDRVHLQDKGYT